MKISLHTIAIAFLFTALIACKHKPWIAERKTVSQNPELQLDSASVEKFFLSNPTLSGQNKSITGFYRKRNYAFAWIHKQGIDEHAGNFINLLSNEKSDSFPALSRLNSLFNEVSEMKGKINPKDSRVTELELLLTDAFFDYAKRNWDGGNTDYSKKVDWFIDKKTLDYSAMLDSMLLGKMKEEPVYYHQYYLLKQYLAKYDSIEKSGTWQEWTADAKKLHYGDTSKAIPEIRNRLFMLGDLSANDSSNVFDSTLVYAVMQFQNRHGLYDDGVIASKTLQQIAVSIHSRIEQILVNMERCRWVPGDLKGDYVFVNIPAFTLYAYRNSKFQWSCNVVVGKDTTRTAIFNGTFQYVVFNPYWNIPRSILIHETLPAIKADKNYLAKHNMEVTDNSGKVIPVKSIKWSKYKGEDFPYNIRQKPGDDNALGKIKFLFPNSFGIYLHDTPSKALFGENRRTFSHGCIRVEDPMTLAQFLLLHEEHWTAQEIIQAIDENKEKYIKLKNKIPVFIAYFTAWVGDDGKLNFRDDVYGYDAKLKELLLPGTAGSTE